MTLVSTYGSDVIDLKKFTTMCASEVFCSCRYRGKALFIQSEGSGSGSSLSHVDMLCP